jgi:hypothetical protein
MCMKQKKNTCMLYTLRRAEKQNSFDPLSMKIFFLRYEKIQERNFVFLKKSFILFLSVIFIKVIISCYSIVKRDGSASDGELKFACSNRKLSLLTSKFHIGINFLSTSINNNNSMLSLKFFDFILCINTNI